MKTVAVYSMKGGVGKTTAAVNLAYLTAASGQRTLLWDLDPQAASSFAFRVQPHVAHFGRRSLEGGRALRSAIKETDYGNLDLLPADFAYRKLDRFLDDLGDPDRVVTALIESLGREYDSVFLDCPAGFSLMTEGIFAAADVILAPTIPSLLSLRMVAQLGRWGDRSGSPATLAAFFSMVDRRKGLHRRICEWATGDSHVFLNSEIPYASIVEQMTVRRAPLGVYAAGSQASVAFEELWALTASMLGTRENAARRSKDYWKDLLRDVDGLMLRLETASQQPGSVQPAATETSFTTDGDLVHRFDTDDRSLESSGCLVELREHRGSLVVVALSTSGREQHGLRRVQARIDRAWALQILSGEMSPLDALQERLGVSELVTRMTALVDGRRVRRIESRLDRHGVQESGAVLGDASSATVKPAALSLVVREALPGQ